MRSRSRGAREPPSPFRSDVDRQGQGVPHAVLRAAIPSILTSVRVLALPGLILLILHGRRPAALGLYAVVLLSDFTDGRMARRLGTATRFGAYADVLADMAVVHSLLIVFAIRGLLPAWLPAVPAAVSAAFLASSRHSAPRYDPIGKHYGTILYIGAGILIWGAGPMLRVAIWASIIAMSVLVLASRSLAAWRSSQSNLSS